MTKIDENPPCVRRISRHLQMAVKVPFAAKGMDRVTKGNDDSADYVTCIGMLTYCRRATSTMQLVH